MPILTTDFNDLVKNAKVQGNNTAMEFPEVRNQIAVIKNVTEKKSEYSSLSTLPTARKRGDGANAYKGSAKQGYTKNFNQEDFALEVDVSYQMRKFDKYDEIMKRVRAAKNSVVRRFEQNIAGILGYAWSSSYQNLEGDTVTTTTPDGTTLISASHACNGSAATWSNQLTGNHAPISQTTLEDLLQLFNNFLDDGDGRSLTVLPTTIISGTHFPTVHEINRILGSELASGTPNNDKNVNKGLLNHIIVPFLDFTLSTEARDSTKSKYVFVANLNSDINGIVAEVSADPFLDPPATVTESGIWQFVASGMQDFGTVRASFIAGTKGTGAAI